MRGLSGYLLASTLGSMLERETFVRETPLREGGPTLRFHGSMYNLRQWDVFELTSPISLEDDGAPESAGPGPFNYQLVIVRGFSKLIVLADRRRVVDYVIGQLFDRTIVPRLRKVTLHLDMLIRECEQSASPYLITSVLGRFAGPERHVRAIALYGDDITDSPLFRDYGHRFNVYSCGMGRRFVMGVVSPGGDAEGEIIRVGNDGFVLAHLGSRTKAKDFLDVIGFIVDRRFVEDWVPISDHGRSGLG